jgi:protein SCO1/2
MKRPPFHGLVALLLLCLTVPAHARIDTSRIGWDQRPGAHLPLQLRFRDENHRVVTLGRYFVRTPVVLVMTYFACPELCPIVLHGVQESLQKTGLEAGRDYTLVAVSIDPRDTHLRAEHARQRVAQYLTAADDSASVLARALGFRYVYDPEHGQFAHPAGFVVVEPGGQISRYVLGVSYSPSQVRSALIDAGRGRVAAWTDQMLLLCYHFDPMQGRYSLAILNVLRILGVAAVLAGIVGWWRWAAP